MLGNLCGDFVRGVELDSLAEPVQRGIAQHRAIDAFVDSHPVTRRSCARLTPHRFAGVLVDVFYDHYLARHWSEFGDGRSLRAFVDAVHDLLAAHVEYLPPRLQQVLPVMRHEDWLASYAELDGIDRVLRRMAGRGRRRSVLAAAGAELRAHYSAFEEDFRELWPALQARAQAFVPSDTGR